MNKQIGSSFDRFLEEEGLLAKTQLSAIKRMIALQVKETMEKRRLTKTSMANQMGTSRAALERLLDPKNTSITLQTLDRAVRAIGKKLRLEIY